MLEVKNLVKVYKPKKGKEVRALNDVSIKFPEKGLVFILGKSGCGKSTLLNMLGGLDRVDSGEIIIKGKSSKDFSQADFDSYRNTYLGFIFQEYNILNEFTVGANVALALELQGKKATKEAINDILSQVELEEYATRKPMQLSGGQKQRIAIARALVKNPEIILADEPTGALDSKTGIQVFDTLKELSKSKLVIVVSHDREFAESYGDRVIELKDGQVISDIEKYVAESEKKNESISVIDDKIIQIKQGYELTKDDVKMINDYLQKNNAILSIDEMSNRDLKKFARINDSGNKECFKETDESEIVYEKQPKFKLIKSRLPFKDSFKIGASGLKAKPVRLFISILLSLVAFTLFGLADTINAYNKYTATVDSLIDSEVDNLSFTKQVEIQRDNYTDKRTVLLTNEDLAGLKTKIGLDFKGVYSPGSGINLSSNTIKSPSWGSLYPQSLKGVLESNAQDVQNNGFTLYGKYPENNEEIAITEYTYRTFKQFGYRTSDNSESYEKGDTKLATPDNFLATHPTLRMDNTDYEIVGIIDTKFNYNHFKALDVQEGSSSGSSSITDFVLVQELESTAQYGYHGQVYVKEGFIQDVYLSQKGIGIDMSYSAGSNVSIYYNPADNMGSNYVSVSRVINTQGLTQAGGVYKSFDGSESVSNRDFMIDIGLYKDWVRSSYVNQYGWDESSWIDAPVWILNSTVDTKYDEIRNSCYDDLLVKALSHGFYFGEWEYDSVEGKYTWKSVDASGWTDENKRNNLESYLNSLSGYLPEEPFPTWVVAEDGYDFEDYNDIYNYNYYKAQQAVYSTYISTITSVDPNIRTDYMRSYSNDVYGINEYTGGEATYPATLVGVFYAPVSYAQSKSYSASGIVVIADATYAQVASAKQGIYAFALTKMPAQNQLKNIVKWAYDNTAKEGTRTIHFELKAGPTELLGMVNGLLEDMSEVFLYVGIGFAVFAALLMMNYIATTISYKKRDIGILRAVGARSVDVFGIFFNESLIIAFINFVLSSIATFGFVFYINNMMRNKYNITLTILNFGIRQVGLILLIAVVVAAFASAIPVFNIARKKPIDAIRSI